MLSFLVDPQFDAAYAWKTGGRVRIMLKDGRALQRAVHGQTGSMHDPLADRELDQKLKTLVGDSLGAEVPEAVRSLGARPVRGVTTLLRRPRPSSPSTSRGSRLAQADRPDAVGRRGSPRQSERCPT